MFELSDIPNREYFGELLNSRNLTGDAVEVGTHRGEIARKFLSLWKGRMLFCVDPYVSGYANDPAAKGDREADYRAAWWALQEEFARVTFIRTPSVAAAESFRDESLDFVYIDGSHLREDVEADIASWWRNVKPGGILAGHDLTGVWEEEVKPVVEAFLTRNGLQGNVVMGDAADHFPPFGDAASWFVYKP